MDYYEIGQRIRKVRKMMGLSQEELAERVDISVTHMSHIETGNTKLSLPVLVQIAECLSVPTDDLLFSRPSTEVKEAVEELNGLLNGCSAREIRFLTDVLRGVKIAMAKQQL